MGTQHGTGALIKIPCSILIGWRSLILPSTVRLGSAHRTIPAKIFVENLNCPDLTASFLAGARSLANPEDGLSSSSAIALPWE